MNVLLAVAALHLVVLVVPGPDVLLVSRAALARSRRAALLAGLGVCLGIACWAGLALLGINFLFAQFPWIHGVIKVAGGLYLLWMGLNLWRSAGHGEAEAGAQSPAVAHSDWANLRAGFLTNIANPKAAVFFGSVFSSVLGAHTTPGLKLAVFGVVVSLSLAWFALVACGMSTRPVQAAYLRARKGIDRVAGTLMLGFGGLLLASRE
ncbi:LysE family transporter [uncultured Deinococcus sp.]|uniref:LysE family transporter n=1 Tax=uncultured Deinococcus sp. TaxID=158789 RepID=UPI0025862B88|nr:LysE family transporter [uncultured Deinococcus sp.]